MNTIDKYTIPELKLFIEATYDVGKNVAGTSIAEKIVKARIYAQKKLQRDLTNMVNAL